MTPCILRMVISFIVNNSPIGRWNNNQPPLHGTQHCVSLVSCGWFSQCVPIKATPLQSNTFGIRLGRLWDPRWGSLSPGGVSHLFYNFLPQPCRVGVDSCWIACTPSTRKQLMEFYSKMQSWCKKCKTDDEWWHPSKKDMCICWSKVGFHFGTLALSSTN